MKRFVSILLVSLLLLCVGASTVAAEEIDTGVALNVYNWGEYIDPEVNDLFTEETGIKINYTNFDNNESMYAKINTPMYDVIVPSDYMVGRLIKEGKLAKLNFENIPNASKINPSLLNPNYDPENAYSVPYTWGTVGIFYNTKYVAEEDLKAGWDLLWNEKYSGRIFMFDNPRDAFGIALLKCGFSLNTTNKEEWDIAYEELRKQKPLLHQYVMDQVYDKMINEEAWIAPYYAGDGIVMMDEEEGNPAIDFFVPTTGTNVFVDALCVPANAKHKREAEEYINFLCRPDIALLNAEYIGYSTPLEEVRAELDPEIGENEIFYPPEEVLAKTEMFETLPDEISTYMDTLWMKLKLADPAWSVFTILVGVAAVVCFTLYIVRRVRGKR